MSGLVTERLLAEQARLESELMLALEVVAAWAGLPADESVPPPEAGMAVEATAPFESVPRARPGPWPNGAPGGSLPETKVLESSPDRAASVDGHAWSSVSPPSVPRPSGGPDAPDRGSTHVERVAGSSAAEPPKRAQLTSLATTSARERRVGAQSAEDAARPDPTLMVRAALSRNDRGRKQRLAMIDPPQVAARERASLTRPEPAGARGVVAFTPVALSVPERPAIGPDFRFGTFERGIAPPAFSIAQPGRARTEALPQRGRIFQAAAEAERHASASAPPLVGDPFHESALEEQVADALERAALEAGIDLA